MTIKPVTEAVLYALAEMQFGRRVRDWGLHFRPTGFVFVRGR